MSYMLFSIWYPPTGCRFPNRKANVERDEVWGAEVSTNVAAMSQFCGYGCSVEAKLYGETVGHEREISKDHLIQSTQMQRTKKNSTIKVTDPIIGTSKEDMNEGDQMFHTTIA